MKTARFARIVEKCGAPEIHLAWVPPPRDPVLKKALGENRVMTIHQELRGGKKDYGTVGYLKGDNAQILFFPKSLRRFADRRIVAIDYSLLSKDTREPGPRASHAKPARPRAVRPKPPKKTPRPAAPKKTPVLTKWSIEKILTEVKHAKSELTAGKSVPAYERLERLLAHASA